MISIHGCQAPAPWTRTRPPRADHLPAAARTVLRAACEPGADVQLVLAAGALRAAPGLLGTLLPALWRGCAVRGRSVGRPIIVHGWHVGVEIDIGRLLGAKTVLVLVDDTAARTSHTRVAAYVAQPHATPPSAPYRVRTDGDPELVALRLLTAISRQRAARPPERDF
jgi:ethanolamine ammonia-lyase small subunit